MRFYVPSCANNRLSCRKPKRSKRETDVFFGRRRMRFNFAERARTKVLLGKFAKKLQDFFREKKSKFLESVKSMPSRIKIPKKIGSIFLQKKNEILISKKPKI